MRKAIRIIAYTPMTLVLLALGLTILVMIAEFLAAIVQAIGVEWTAAITGAAYFFWLGRASTLGWPLRK